MPTKEIELLQGIYHNSNVTVKLLTRIATSLEKLEVNTDKFSELLMKLEAYETGTKSIKTTI